MSYKFQIPRQKDQSLIEALTLIRDELAGLIQLKIRVQPHFNAPVVNVDTQEPKKSENIAYVLRENSEVMPLLLLFDPSGNENALTITRHPNQITDEVVILWNTWITRFSPEQQAPIFVRLNSAARRHLKPWDAEASLEGGGNSEWSRYRDSQQAILNSLQETQKAVIVESARHTLEAEAAAKAKYDKLETELRTSQATLLAKLSAEHKARMEALDQREGLIKSREESFNTKEARYVARQEQQKQISQIEGWLKGWSLTKGTTDKRNWVLGAYGAGILASAGFTIWFSIANIEILKATDLSSVAWWQWVLLSLKSILPFAAFTTFVIYFIRWSSAWARQHAEEEFRNRSRILDIGRTAWLLEAVRDAQDNDKELPPDLVKELSRNLFSYGGHSDSSELHPQAFSDLVMQGLSSIRVKSSDGTEVEASRSKKQK